MKPKAIQTIRTDLLHFDAKNPRLAEYGLDAVLTEDEILEILWEAMDVQELVQSIAASGFFKNEALILAEEDGKYVVIEGNRRLAAVKALRNPALAAEKHWSVPILSIEKRSGLDELPAIRGFRSCDDAQVNANDDKLDVVGWIPFADQMAAQIIVFGQCKTGTSWSEGLCQLQPDAFIKTWVDGHFLVDPVRAFFVTEAVNRARWGTYAAKGGILFDRCRLVDCCSSIEVDLLDRMRAWGSAAIQAARRDL